MDSKDIRKSIEHHFEKQMMIQKIELEGELHFSDSKMLMMFIFTSGYLRILMRSAQHSFSKNFNYDYIFHWIDTYGKDGAAFVRHSVKENSGKESENMLEDWYEWKKQEIRDRKISDLGI